MGIVGQPFMCLLFDANKVVTIIIVNIKGRFTNRNQKFLLKYLFVNNNWQLNFADIQGDFYERAPCLIMPSRYVLYIPGNTLQ